MIFVVHLEPNIDLDTLNHFYFTFSSSTRLMHLKYNFMYLQIYFVHAVVYSLLRTTKGLYFLGMIQLPICSRATNPHLVPLLYVPVYLHNNIWNIFCVPVPFHRTLCYTVPGTCVLQLHGVPRYSRGIQIFWLYLFIQLLNNSMFQVLSFEPKKRLFVSLMFILGGILFYFVLTPVTSANIYLNSIYADLP